MLFRSSVRSAYRVMDASERAVAHFNSDFTSPSCGEADPIWKKLWKLSVPPKIKCFWWRVLRGFLPVREVLHKRRLEAQSTCTDCGAKDESIFHALSECTFAKLFWKSFKGVCHIKFPSLHPDTWARDILDCSLCPANEVCAILCGLWSVWTARNNRKHGVIPMDITKACRWALDTASDLLSCSPSTGNLKPRSTLARSEERRVGKECLL